MVLFFLVDPAVGAVGGLGDGGCVGMMGGTVGGTVGRWDGGWDGGWYGWVVRWVVRVGGTVGFKTYGMAW